MMYKEHVSKEVIEKWKKRETVEQALSRDVSVEKIPPRKSGKTKAKSVVINKSDIPAHLRHLVK